MKDVPPKPPKTGARVRDGAPRLISDAGGRIPAFEPTDQHREIVTTLSANSTPRAIIAKLLGISLSTLEKYFRQDILDGKAQITARVGLAVVREALAGNMAAARYWLTTHGGPEWKTKDAYQPDRDEESSGVIHFFLPKNGRDMPEEEVGPQIDGVAEKTGTDE